MTVLLSSVLKETSTYCSGDEFWRHTQNYVSSPVIPQRASLLQFEEARCPDTPPCGDPSVHHPAVLVSFLADFLDTQINTYNYPKTDLFHALKTCGYSISQAKINIIYLSHTLDVDVSPAC